MVDELILKFFHFDELFLQDSYLLLQGKTISFFLFKNFALNCFYSVRHQLSYHFSYKISLLNQLLLLFFTYILGLSYEPHQVV